MTTSTLSTRGAVIRPTDMSVWVGYVADTLDESFDETLDETLLCDCCERELVGMAYFVAASGERTLCDGCFYAWGDDVDDEDADAERDERVFDELLTRAPSPSDSTSDSTSSDTSNEDAALATEIIAAYLLSDTQVAQLERAIATARLASYRAAYLAAAQAANVASVVVDTSSDTVDSNDDDGDDDSSSATDSDASSDTTDIANWEPSADVVDACEQDAQSSAQHIAATYQRDIGIAALGFLATYRDAHGGDMRGAASALSAHLHEWATARATWKSEQVAQHETSDAGSVGTQDAVSDALDEQWLDDAGDIVDATEFLVAVVPAESSSDFCANYAGQYYTLDEAPSLDFPAHMNCIHYLVFIPYADDDAPFD